MPIKRMHFGKNSIPIIHGKAELELHDAKVRSKAIDELERRLIINFSNWQMSLAEIGNEKEYDTIEKAIKGIEEIAEQMKDGQ